MSASSGGKCDSFKFYENESEALPDFMDEEKTYLECAVASFDDGFFETDWKSCTDAELKGYILTGDSLEENIEDIVGRLNESSPENN